MSGLNSPHRFFYLETNSYTVKQNIDWELIVSVAVAFLATAILVSFNGSGNALGNFSADSDETRNFPNFTRVDQKVGLETNSSYTEQDFVGYSGLYVNDFNKDGWEDLLTVDGKNAVLFENKDGEFSKTGILSDYDNVASAHFLDHDNSGSDDLLILRRNAEPVFLENKDGKFSEKDVGFNKRLTRPFGAFSADYNSDGCVDIMITQWGGDKALQHEKAREVLQTHPETRPNLRTGHGNFLYKGSCGSFRKVNEESEIGESRHLTFTGSFVDLNEDGRLDIHMANDFARDIIYINQGDGTFEKRDVGTSSDRNAMSSNLADLNGDLKPDIFVTNVYYPNKSVDNLDNKLVQTRTPVPEGNNAFINTESLIEDRAEEIGLREGGWGWGSAISDFSNDGNISVIHTTMTSHRVLNPPEAWRQLMIFKGNGSSYNKLNSSHFGFEIDNGRSIESFDYDRDGDLDLVTGLNTRNGDSEKRFKLYRNDGEGRFLQIELESRGRVTKNAELYLNTTEGIQYRILDSRSDMLSQGSRIAHFGLGDARINSLKVVYPDGEELVFNRLRPNRRYMMESSPKSREIVFKEGFLDE